MQIFSGKGEDPTEPLLMCLYVCISGFWQPAALGQAVQRYEGSLCPECQQPADLHRDGSPQLFFPALEEDVYSASSKVSQALYFPQTG